ncbi:glycosyltransferase [Duncaniella muris]|uniref:glycosyltransferase n=1 Tax=Duncaniella muris TaxID=2094150 RepID=UPI0023F39ACD|nr:glycosyltransferase [Duncaniella muris]
MRILMTCDPEIPVPPGKYGGVERLVSGLCQEYQAMGHEVYLVANSESTEPVHKRFGWKSKKSRGLKNVLANAFKLREIVREIKPDVIHSFSRLLYLYPMFISGTKVHVLQTYGRAISQRSTDMARRICGKYIHFACCGAHMLKNIKGYEDWNVVYNFTDTDYFKAPDIERKYLVFLGRIEDIKGTHEAIMVAKKSNTPLIIAGNIEPEHQEYFDTKVKPYIDGEFIRYIGPVDDQQKQSLLEGAKAFLMPIKWEEPFGIVMVEAMACGAPVLAFRRGSVPEIVVDGTGMISDSIHEMAKHVGTMKCISPAALNRYVKNTFSREVIASHYINLFYQWLKQ